MIERGGGGGGEGGLAAPQVTIEKVRLEGTGTGGQVVAGEGGLDGGSEYTLQEDAAWEFPRELLELGSLLGEGTFGRVVQVMFNTSYCTVHF